MIRKIVFILAAIGLASAQIPSLGFCPDYVPMANFDMNKFLGVWYEAERYFQLTEVVSRCVMTNYTLGPDGKFRVSNEVTNRFTGIKRVLEGEVKKAASKAEEGKLSVKYTIPLTPETKYSVLETDYDTYAVLWSCSGIGPFHTQNAWVMTRERLAPGTVLQKAYAVLDKYKISKTFFVKTDQEDCAYLDATPVKPAKPAEVASQSEVKPQETPDQDEHVRSAVAPDAPQIIVEAYSDEKPSMEPQVVDPVPQKSAIQVPERIMGMAVAAKQEEPHKESVAIKEETSKETAKEKVDENRAQQTEKTKQE